MGIYRKHIHQVYVVLYVQILREELTVIRSKVGLWFLPEFEYIFEEVFTLCYLGFLLNIPFNQFHFLYVVSHIKFASELIALETTCYEIMDRVGAICYQRNEMIDG